MIFKGEVEACGYSYVTDSKWTCSSQPPADESWLTADFDDSQWERATWVRRVLDCLSSDWRRRLIGWLID